MLDSFSSIQEEAYKLVTNALKNGTISHAYVIETKGVRDKTSFALSFAKSLLCPKIYTNLEQCNGCSQCERIEMDSFSDFQIIETDTMQIKKNQLLDLQVSFSTKSTEGNRRVYLIKDADKLNESASNTILKFLEEPDNDIVAILQTDNIYQLLPTILSRCQYIRLKSEEDYLSYISEEQVPFLEQAISFVNYYEKNKLNTLLYTDTIWFNTFTSRESMDFGFETMILYYKDLLNKTLGRKIEIFSKYRDKIDELDLKASNVMKKINLLTEAKQNLKSNVNNHLLLDKLIIDFKGVDEND